VAGIEQFVDGGMTPSWSGGFDGRSVTHTMPKSLTLNRLANHLVL
jgi:hypothetical protein